MSDTCMAPDQWALFFMPIWLGLDKIPILVFDVHQSLGWVFMFRSALQKVTDVLRYVGTYGHLPTNASQGTLRAGEEVSGHILLSLQVS